MASRRLRRAWVASGSESIFRRFRRAECRAATATRSSNSSRKATAPLRVDLSNVVWVKDSKCRSGSPQTRAAPGLRCHYASKARVYWKVRRYQSKRKLLVHGLRERASAGAPFCFCFLFLWGFGKG